ncbi:hypothetical protein [Streptomyces lunaelactis]|uniref:hypothetical protein n=1 Tax=Streptomyces lunaelactis TaxID=1535768 RepID=UPI0015855B11|nr:hypothetical protein [Streptomyces lunaelactis]NUK05298.1 hypothetical protein [Streptomyces lunaelactis]NUK17019.1 hypothetical protein [Streptomyces lunaelactis]NUK26508.1 hypothetical protein [Streptomyces lunaelactis]
MALSYQDVINADLSPLSDVAEAWRKMGDRFGELKVDYTTHVQRALDNGNWQGNAFGAHQNTSRATVFEYAAAKKEALTVVGLLEEAHTVLTRLQKAVKDLVADAEEKDYKVDSSGRATYIGYDKLSPQERFAFQHDPDYDDAITLAKQRAQEWTHDIAAAVKAVDDADQGVQRALTRATMDISTDGSGIGGFNARDVGGLKKAGAPDAETATQTDSWPHTGFTVTGPKYGKEGTVKAYVDLFHGTAEGSMTQGRLTLSGIADIYGGARATGNFGVSDKGFVAKAEASAGVRALAEGRAEYGHVAGYGRAEGFAGAEAGVSAKVTKEEVTVGAKAFAGAKGTVAGGAEVAGIGVGVAAEGWAGPGAEAWWGYKKDEQTGEYKIGGKAGASPMLGGAVGLEITVDPDKVAKAAGDAADYLGDTVDTVGDAAGSVKDTVSDWLS